MRKSRASEERIVGIPKEHFARTGAKALCRKHGISAATFCKGRPRHGGLDLSEAKRLKALWDAGATPGKTLAERMPDVAALKEMPGMPAAERHAFERAFGPY